MHIFRSHPWLLISVLMFVGCASIMHYENVKKLETNEEYEQKIQVKEITPSASATPLPQPSLSISPMPTPSELAITPAKPLPSPSPSGAANKPGRREKKSAKKVAKTKLPVSRGIIVEEVPGPRQPDIEESEGFKGRRPIRDPFRVGEEVDLALTYMRITAGHLKIKVMPFVEVNGQKAYHYQITAKSSEFFSKIYSVDDYADTYVNYKTLLPYNLETHVRESKQLKEIRSYIDHEKSKADYWEKKVTKEHGEESKKLQWDILPYTQNVISAAYYMRNFVLTPGKTIHFRLTDEGKNIVFRGHVLRRERLDTYVGELDTIIIKPDFEIDGVFKPVGEILFWVTDDDRKMIVRIEAAIKIGTLVAKIVKIEKGQEIP